MQHFARTDEQRLLAQNLTRLLSETSPIERAKAAAVPAGKSALWGSFAELGILGAAFNEELGGFAGDARTIAVVMAEIGSGLVLEPYLDSAVVAGRVLESCADEAYRSEAIQEIIAGSIYIVAHSIERPLTARRDGDGVLLSGKAACVRHGAAADVLLAMAVGDEGSPGFFAVPRDTRGLELTGYRLIDGAYGADIAFKDVRVPRAARLSLAASATSVLENALEWGLMASVAETTGILSELNAATFAYLTSRKQFGVVLGSFQALQHRAADMHIAGEESVAIADACVDVFAGGTREARSALICAAKVMADGAAKRIGAEAVQLHGGMGVSEELIVSHYARRLVAIRHSHGSTDALRLSFGSPTPRAVTAGSPA